MAPSTLNPAEFHPGQEYRRPNGEVLAVADRVSLPRRKIFNPPSPNQQQARQPHWRFRGLLGVHFHYGLSAR